MTVLNIDPRAAEAASAEWKPGGDFALPKTGVGIPFEILGDDDKPAWGAVRTIPETGEEYENFEVKTVTLDDNDKEIKYYYKFRLGTEKGLSKWKTFLSALHGRVLSGEEVANFDSDNLIGVRFTADVERDTDKTNPAKSWPRIDFKTISVEGGMPEPEVAAAKPAKPARPGARR